MNEKPIDFDNELFISDLDGTLLSPQHEISPSTVSVLKDAISKGLKFTVASARSCFSIRQLLHEIPLNYPIIANNGAVLFSPEGKRLYQANLDHSSLEVLYDHFKRLHQTPLLSVEGDLPKLFYAENCNGWIDEYMALKKASGDGRVEKIDDVFGVKEGIITVTLLDTKARMEEAFASLLQADYREVNMYLMDLPDIEGLCTITILSKEADKGKTLSRLRTFLNEPVKVTAFGDQLNDISLLNAADYKVAVANAVEPLKAIADHICRSNGEEGVALYIRERIETDEAN
jgi:hypothetical protein